VFHLTVREHERLPVVTSRQAGERALTQHEVNALLRACQKGGVSPISVGYNCVKFAQQCGVIQAKGVSVEILPKVAGDDGFDRGLLLRMLAVAHNLPVARLDASSLHFQSHSVLHVLIQWFCSELSTQCHSGLLREYVVQSDDLAVIRGRWRPDLDIRHSAGRKTRLSCEFDELTADNRYNRALKAALRRVRGLMAGVSALLREIDLLLGWFAEVSDVAVTADDVTRLPKNRLVARYARALEMAVWFLAKRAPDLSSGSESGFAMLFDMNMLFQAFLGRMLRRALPSGFNLREESPRYFLTQSNEGDGRFQMKPDFCILAGQDVVAIIDAKWKRLAPNSSDGKWGVQQTDIYQLHAYATAYQCDTVALWYPSHADTEDREERPKFRFITAGREVASSSASLDWVRLSFDVSGVGWIDAIKGDLAACLDRLGVVEDTGVAGGA
jgi:5-methylcytosine-specific restriction enzyme subunit McrC